jgi:hypothetical protein
VRGVSGDAVTVGAERTKSMRTRQVFAVLGGSMPARNNAYMMNGRTRRAANGAATDSLLNRLFGRTNQKALNSRHADSANLACVTSILRFQLALANVKRLLAEAREDTLAVTSYCDLLARDNPVTSPVTCCSIPKQEAPAGETGPTRIYTPLA